MSIRTIHRILALAMALALCFSAGMALAEESLGTQPIDPAAVSGETPTSAPEPTATPTPSPTPAPEPTAKPTEDPTDKPTPEPTAEPSAEPSAVPSADPTETPSAPTPTPEAKEEATPAPEQNVTPSPTAELPGALKAIALDKNTLEMIPEDTVQLKAALDPAEAKADIIWSSSDEKIAVVKGGLVTAVAAGKATITASCGEIKAECAVTVSAPAPVTSAPLTPAPDPLYIYGSGVFASPDPEQKPSSGDSSKSSSEDLSPEEPEPDPELKAPEISVSVTDNGDGTGKVTLSIAQSNAMFAITASADAPDYGDAAWSSGGSFDNVDLSAEKYGWAYFKHDTMDNSPIGGPVAIKLAAEPDAESNAIDGEATGEEDQLQSSYPGAAAISSQLLTAPAPDATLTSTGTPTVTVKDSNGLSSSTILKPATVPIALTAACSEHGAATFTWSSSATDITVDATTGAITVPTDWTGTATITATCQQLTGEGGATTPCGVSGTYALTVVDKYTPTLQNKSISILSSDTSKHTIDMAVSLPEGAPAITGTYSVTEVNGSTFTLNGLKVDSSGKVTFSLPKGASGTATANVTFTPVNTDPASEVSGILTIKVIDAAQVGVTDGLTVSKVEIKTLPSQRAYYPGEPISLSGGMLAVTLKNTDNTETTIELPLTASGVSLSRTCAPGCPGKYTIKVTYGNMSDSYDIEVYRPYSPCGWPYYPNFGWNGVEQLIWSSKPGSVIRMNVPGDGQLPASVMRALYYADDVTLVLTNYAGGVIRINSDDAIGPNYNYHSYPLVWLAQMYDNSAPRKSSGSGKSSIASSTSSKVPVPDTGDKDAVIGDELPPELPELTVEPTAPVQPEKPVAAPQPEAPAIQPEPLPEASAVQPEAVAIAARPDAMPMLIAGIALCGGALVGLSFWLRKRPR